VEIISKYMRKTKIDSMVCTWRNLRRPFILPQVPVASHVCEWEKIDIDVLGCIVCGRFHACEQGSCQSTTETSDGLVCDFSGIVIRDKKFVETEFLDTMNVIGTEQMEIQNTMFSSAEQIVRTVLFSITHKQTKQKAMCSTLTKLQDNLRARTAIPDSNFMVACQEFLSGCMKTPYVFTHVSDDERRQLVRDATEQCCKVLQILIRNGMPIRSHEIQRLTVGVLYLMRTGVVFQNVYVLPRRTDICSLLPPETMLRSFFGVHPKCITEIENRLKFCLRRGVEAPVSSV